MVNLDLTDHTSGTKFRLRVMLGLVPSCFLLRAVIMTVGMFVPFISYALFDIIYFTTLEVVPLLLVLRISLRIIQLTSIILQADIVNQPPETMSIVSMKTSSIHSL